MSNTSKESRVTETAHTGRYEPCVINQDGDCTRWSHDHAPARHPNHLHPGGECEACDSFYDLEYSDDD